MSKLKSDILKFSRNYDEVRNAIALCNAIKAAGVCISSSIETTTDGRACVQDGELFFNPESKIHVRGLRPPEWFPESHPFHGNVNRLFDTKGMNRISGKLLKTRDSGTLGVAGIPCLLLELCQSSTGAAVTDGHSGHSFAPSPCPL